MRFDAKTLSMLLVLVFALASCERPHQYRMGVKQCMQNGNSRSSCQCALTAYQELSIFKQQPLLLTFAIDLGLRPDENSEMSDGVRVEIRERSDEISKTCNIDPPGWKLKVQ